MRLDGFIRNFLTTCLAYAVVDTAAAQQRMSMPDMVAAASKSIVAIEVRRVDGREFTGSGFIVESSGTVVTSFHVVQDAVQVQVRLPTDETYGVVGVRAADAKRDIAILQVPAFDLPVAILGNSGHTRIGERVVAIGNALGLLNNSVTTGVVSGMRDAGGTRLFQIDAAVSPGNSGGPVLNESGQVIAVVRGKLVAGESLNFAVPINYARGLMQMEPTKGLALLASPPPDDEAIATAAAVSAATEEASPPGFPVRWRSVVSGTTRAMRVSEDRIYIETEIPPNLRRVGAMSIADLRKQGDNWVGTHRIRNSCKVFPFPRRLCPAVELPITITALSESRIEGTGEYPPDGVEFSCGRCAYEWPVSPKPFVWIPVD